MSRVSIQKILFQSAFNDGQYILLVLASHVADGSLVAQPFSTNRKYPSNQHLQYVKDLYLQRFDILNFVQLMEDNRSIVDVL